MELPPVHNQPLINLESQINDKQKIWENIESFSIK